jgi:hypothetical protein
MALCGSCEWHGQLLTGWVPFKLAERLLRPAPQLLTDPKLRRARGETIEVRVRLRHVRCPKCGERALQRAVDPAEVERVLASLGRSIRRI